MGAETDGPAAVRAAFENKVYGRWPDDTRAHATVLSTTRRNDGVIVHELRVETESPVLSFIAALAMPADATGPLPCLVGLNFAGNAQAFGEQEVVAEGWGRIAEWPIAEIAGRGYAIATVQASDIMPDDADAAVEVLARFSDGDRDAHSTGALAAWGWGLSCLVSALAERDDIDVDRLMAFGHSRLGKAALVATAMDPRIALLAVAGSGCGGAAPWRVSDGDAIGEDGTPRVETLEAITTRFPHWFAGELASFHGRIEDLPVEQSDLIALCRPRPIIVSNGIQDRWANPQGQLDMLRDAAEAYRRVVDVDELPATADQQLGVRLGGRLGWFCHDGAHVVTRDEWRAWLDFADEWLGCAS